MLSEIIETIKNAKTDNEKRFYLQRNLTPALKVVLQYALHPSIQLYTKEVPSYIKDDSPAGLSVSSLYQEYKKFYILLTQEQEFIVSYKKTANKRKQDILIQMLESLHQKDAKVLESIIQRDFSQKYGITKELVESIIPGLFK